MTMKIRLETMTDITKFQDIISKIDGDIKLVDGTGYCVNAKSILGAIAALEWKNLYVKSDKDLYTVLKEFCV